jgi:large subunit ribosomal protein L5
LTTKQKENSNIEKLVPRLKSKYNEEVIPQMMSEFSLTNRLRVPRVTKVVVNVGLGEALVSSNVVQVVARDLQLITGQKPIERKAKKSIANFKLREGQIIGLSVTLRSNNMWFFLDKLFNVSLPRVRDFRGVSKKSFDGNGNYSLGLQEQVIFPEIDYNEIDKLRGMQINFVTTSNSDDESKKLLELLGMPFEENKEN